MSCLSIFMPSVLSGTADAAYAPGLGPLLSLERVEDQWDQNIGLYQSSFSKSGGFSISRNAHILAGLAVEGKLNPTRAEIVLSLLRKAQDKKGVTRGNVIAHWGDKEVGDRNQGFFTTLQLFVLHYEYRDQLSAKGGELLDTFLSEAHHWFKYESNHDQHQKWRYPNAFWGDFVCYWLISEQKQSITKKDHEKLNRLMRYYAEGSWGWGEHLSNGYSHILQEQILAMLMWSEEIDEKEKQGLDEMWRQLDQIEQDQYGGPIVPSIRNYAMEYSPGPEKTLKSKFLDYRRVIQKTMVEVNTIGHLAAMHQIPLPEMNKADRPNSLVIPAQGQAKAQVWINEDYRFGALSHYPFYNDTNHANWGLHWQSMPVSYWTKKGEWAYLQWLSVENDTIRALPGLSRAEAQKNKRCRLSDADTEASTGNTYGQAYKDRFIVYRHLPKVSKSWSEISDRWRIIDSQSIKKTYSREGSWSCLHVYYEKDDVFTVGFMPIMGEVDIVEGKTPIASGAANSDEYWGVAWKELGAHKALSGLWFFSRGHKVASLPAVNIENELNVSFGDASYRIHRTQPKGWR